MIIDIITKSVARFTPTRRVAIEGVQVALGQGVAVLGAMVGVRLLTSVLSPAQYGEVALAGTVGALVTQLSLMPLQQGALRFFGPALEAHELRASLTATWLLARRTGQVVVILTAVAVIGLLLLARYSLIGIVVCAAVLALLSGYERILDALQSVGRQRGITAWHQGLANWLRFLVAFGLVTWLGGGSTAVVLGYALATAVVLASQLAFFYRGWWMLVASQAPSPASTEKWRAQIQGYAGPFMASGAFLWLQQSSDRWGLQIFGATQDVGYYAVLVQLGYIPIILLTGVVVQLVQPILFNKAGDGTDLQRLAQTNRINNHLLYGFLFLTAAGTLGAFMFHRQIFSLLVAPEYHRVSGLMYLMVLSGGCFASGELAAMKLMSGRRTRELSVIKIGTAIVGISLNLIGTYWFGLQGAVLANLGFSATSLAWLLAASRARSVRAPLEASPG